MTTVLVWLLVVLVGGRMRLRPRPRRPIASTAGSTPDIEAVSAAMAVLGGLRDRFAIGLRALRPAAGAPGPEHVAAWCDGLARAVRGGSTLTAAIGDVEPPSPCGATVEAIRLALRRGASLREACAIEPCPSHLAVALTVLRACSGHGGPAAEPLSRTAATMRGRAADAAERRTQSAQARMSAIVMTILPICMLGLLLLTSGSVRLFVGSSVGLGVITVGTALNIAGWQWMRHLIGGGRQ